MKNLTLTVFVFVIGIGTASADKISLCEHWNGPPAWTCGFAFGYSEAGKESCKMEFTNGFPYWSDRGFITVDPDPANWTEYARTYFGKLKNIADSEGLCKCSVKIKCGYINIISNGWIAMPSPQFSHHECEMTPDSLRALKYDRNNGQMTPSC